MAGFLQSANVMGRVPTGVVWGWFGDRFGLRKALVLTMILLAVGSVLFGFCTNAVWAIIVRFVFLGMGNGWVTVFPAMSMEIGGVEKQTAVVGTVFGAGTMVQLMGPAIGGWTYGFVERWPAIIPNLAGAFICFFALATLLMWLPAAKKKKEVKPVPLPAVASVAPAPGFLASACKWPIPLLVVLRSSGGFLNFAFFEVVPLWAISSRSLGGIELGQDILGTVFAVSALLSGLYMVLCLQRVVRVLGLRRCSWVCNLGNAILFVAMPFITNIYLLTVVHAAINSLMGTMAATYIALINNTVDPTSRGKVNGVCATFEAIGKGFGPLSMSVLFAWSLDRWGFSGHYLVFFLLAFLHICLVLTTAFVPSSVETSQMSGQDSLETSNSEESEESEEDQSNRQAEDGVEDKRPKEMPTLFGVARQTSPSSSKANKHSGSSSHSKKEACAEEEDEEENSPLRQHRHSHGHRPQAPHTTSAPAASEDVEKLAEQDLEDVTLMERGRISSPVHHSCQKAVDGSTTL